ncbi:hypothetical protein EYB33_13940 [Lysinibacillus sphaericus]|uniref:hypothetical protein n=1 Tax=Lysinibacillus sphaericus TaxID=1421 RepID=UPI001E43DE0F|nr:hypothetical protein [Lysinibacillus sphaericus]UDK97333.1 hypothetical protein EYB33_13940 [Lysinibacillus sphaericus]
MNKRGNKHLRKILYFMVCAMLRAQGKPNHFVDYYYKLKKQPQRKPHKIANVACINKFSESDISVTDAWHSLRF